MNHSSSSTTPTPLGVFSRLRLIALILLGMILFASVALLLSRAKNQPQASANQIVTERLKKLEANRTAAQTAVQTYAWKDKTAGTVQIPVDRAVELAIAELKSKPVKRSDVAHVPAVPAAPVATGN